MKKRRLLVLSVGTQMGPNVHITLARRRDDLELIAPSSVSNEPSIVE